MNREILKLFIEKGFLVDKEMLDFFSKLNDENLAKSIINQISNISKEKLITRSLINHNFDKIKPVFFGLDNEKKKIIEKFFVNVSISVEIKKECFEDSNDIPIVSFLNPIKVISSPVIASQKLEVRNFVKHFRNRYNFMKSILQQRPELENLTSIDKIGSGNRTFSIIGIVSNKSVTKNKNIILEVEDLTGSLKLLITQNKEEVYKKSKEILLDDVIGFKCSGSREFVFVNDLFYPEAYLKEKKKLNEEIYAVFVSDFHIGSGNFLESNFEKFINWIRGIGADETQKTLLKKIRYLFIVGDSIDGVGIYPGQEKDLVIKDIREQYVKLAKYLKQIPEYITIIQCAGQHDAVRVAEPQPPIGSDFAEPLLKIKNLYLVSNPSLVEIGGSGDEPGINVLMYHGASMHGVVNEIEELRTIKAGSHPAQIVKHLLKRRHLGPSHGITTYIPDSENDPMMIKEVPDIITTGDLHRTDVDMYNNILIISCSCWQSMTAFEEKVGNNPDPCKVPILNLKTRELKILDFSDIKEPLNEPIGVNKLK